MPEWKWTQLISWHMSSFVPSDVCSAHLLVSVLLWILRFSHDWPVVSYLLQPDVLRLPTTHNWHTGQRRVSRDSPTTTSALCERPELRGPVYMLRSLVITDVFNEAAACLVSFLYGNIQSISLTRFCLFLNRFLPDLSATTCEFHQQMFFPADEFHEMWLKAPEEI